LRSVVAGGGVAGGRARQLRRRPAAARPRRARHVRRGCRVGAHALHATTARRARAARGAARARGADVARGAAPRARGRRAMTARRLLLPVLLALLALPLRADDVVRHYRGLSLPDALAALQAQGLRIIYSSDLVRPDMRVQQEPTAVWLHDVLAQLLQPYSLAVRVGPGGSLLVVRAGPAPVMVRVTDPHQGEVIAGEIVVNA